MVQSMSGIDHEAIEVAARYSQADPDGSRTASVIRHTYDQIYDGRHTGRYRLDQLSKTEKTHIGSLIEVNLRREFSDLFQDGKFLDFSIQGIEVDCKYSMRFGGWMVPPEAVNQLLLVCTAEDARSEWSIGVVRATEDRLNQSTNRDAKRTLKRISVADVVWIHYGQQLPENILLHLDRSTADHILSQKSGQRRVDELLRTVTGRPISRATIATVAQQDDPMKRTRSNGGAATNLASEGILVIGGTYAAHRDVARNLGALVPGPSEVISLPLIRLEEEGVDSVHLDGSYWRIAAPGEILSSPAPKLPPIRVLRGR